MTGQKRPNVDVVPLRAGSVRTRVTAAITIVAVLAVGLFAVPLAVAAERLFREQIFDRLARDASRAAGEVPVEGIGGILDVAGVPGLLANAKQFRAARADQLGEWRAFIAAWWCAVASSTPRSISNSMPIQKSTIQQEIASGENGRWRR